MLHSSTSALRHLACGAVLVATNRSCEPSRCASATGGGGNAPRPAPLFERLAALEVRLAVCERRAGPRLRTGGVAAVPPTVLLRERVGTGIGQRTRFVGDPAERAARFPGSNDMIPLTMPRPREGFPLLVQPEEGTAGADWSVAEWAVACRQLLDEELRKHGAVLIHGLPIETPDDFNTFMGALSYPPMYTHGASERKKEAEMVFGASDDVPPEHTLHPHNEQAYLGVDEAPSYPRKIFFCCLRPATKGGETPVVCNRAVTEAMQAERPELWARLKAHGVKYVQTLKCGDPNDPMVENLGGEQTWQKLFATTSKAEVERACVDRGYELQWQSDDSVVLSSTRQATVPESAGGRDIWFNQASNVFSFVPCYGDGGPLEDDTLEYLNAVFWRMSVGFQWAAGDVLVCDNEMAMHARTSFEVSSPPRKIVVGFSRE